MMSLENELGNFLPRCFVPPIRSPECHVRTDPRRILHEAIQKLCALPLDIRQHLVDSASTISPHLIAEWEKLLIRERQLLQSLARHSPGDLYPALSALV